MHLILIHWSPKTGLMTLMTVDQHSLFMENDELQNWQATWRLYFCYQCQTHDRPWACQFLRTDKSRHLRRKKKRQTRKKTTHRPKTQHIDARIIVVWDQPVCRIFAWYMSRPLLQLKFTVQNLTKYFSILLDFENYMWLFVINYVPSLPEMCFS